MCVYGVCEVCMYMCVRGVCMYMCVCEVLMYFTQHFGFNRGDTSGGQCTLLLSKAAG